MNLRTHSHTPATTHLPHVRHPPAPNVSSSSSSMMIFLLSSAAAFAAAGPVVVDLAAYTQAPPQAPSTGSFVADPAHHKGQHCKPPRGNGEWSAYALRVSGATSATQCVGDAGAASSGCGDYMFWKSGQCWCVKASYGSTTCADVITTSGPYTIYKRSAAVRMKKHGLPFSSPPAPDSHTSASPIHRHRRHRPRRQAPTTELRRHSFALFRLAISSGTRLSFTSTAPSSRTQRASAA